MFKRAEGLRYKAYLRQLHSNLLFDWYLEVGCRQGASFAPVRSKTIVIDPFFRVEMNVIGSKPALHVFQTTSDDFFNSGFLAGNEIRLGLSFLDGMHLYEFLLRDFMHAEAASDPAGAILMHDCVPYDHAMTTRDLDNLPRKAWTGDVWKLIPILQKWRPDLTVTVLDCAPTGLVCVTNLSPGNQVLAENHDAIRREFDGVDLESYGVERFAGAFEFADARASAAAGFPMFQPVALDPATAVSPRKLST